jgi:hypothetical protein
MSNKTQINPDKIRAYLATDYRLGHTKQDIVLTIGLHSNRLAALYKDKDVNCGAFITAYNPKGVIQPDFANEKAHLQLAAKLKLLGLHAIEGSGSEENSEWPSEKSFFALGLNRADSIEIGLHFDQDAIVWVDETAVPELVLLR